MPLREISDPILFLPRLEDRFQALINLISSVIDVINAVEIDGGIAEQYGLKLAELQNDMNKSFASLFPADDAKSRFEQQESYNDYKDQTHKLVIDYAGASSNLEKNVKQFNEIMEGMDQLSMDFPETIDTDARKAGVKAMGELARARGSGKKLDQAKAQTILSKFFSLMPEGGFRRFRILPKLRMPWRTSNLPDIASQFNRPSIGMRSDVTGDISSLFVDTPRHSEAHPRPSAISGDSGWDFGDDQSTQSQEGA